jgi:hypothetical protein
VRTGTLVGGIAALALLAAGCGGSSAPPVANLTTTSTSTAAGSTTTAAGPGRTGQPAGTAALVTCLGDHGLSASTGSAANASDQSIHLGGVTIDGNVDPGSPRFQSALRACRKYLPGGGPPSLTPSQKAEWVEGMSQFAACMRAHGVPGFPDPTGVGAFPSGFLSRIDPGAPQFQRGLQTCQSLEPKFGPRIG